MGVHASTCPAFANMLAGGDWKCVYVALRPKKQCKLLIDRLLVMWGALAGGWGIPAVVLSIAMVFSGVSYRFGGISAMRLLSIFANES